MAYSIPSRQQVIEVAQDLASGKRDQVEVGLWAAEIDKPENEKAEQRLRKVDPVLRNFLDTLSLAAEPIYDKEDFQSWLDEFLEETKRGS